MGTLIALTFLLTLEDPHRFGKSRDVGGYLGLQPGRRKSGESEPQLHIGKEGDPYLRTLLVQGAQNILGPFGIDCDLRRWGLKLAERWEESPKEEKSRTSKINPPAARVSLVSSGSVMSSFAFSRLPTHWDLIVTTASRHDPGSFERPYGPDLSHPSQVTSGEPTLYQVRELSDGRLVAMGTGAWIISKDGTNRVPVRSEWHQTKTAHSFQLRRDI